MNINKDISNYFLSDAKEYLLRYDILKENSTYIGNRSKLLVDLMFALECLLKAILFSESDLNTKDTYSKIWGHNFDKLYNQLSPNSKKKFNNCIKENLSKYQIKIRYQLESEIDFRNEQGVLDQKYYDTIANPVWLDKVYQQINCLLRYVEKLNILNLEPISFSEININNELEKVKLLRDLRNKST